MDSFIDELVEFEETVNSKGNDFLSAQQVLQRQFDSRNLPPIELKRFDGNPELWPEFIENFYSRVHRMASFDNNLKMDRLLSVLDGDAKRSIQSIGSSRIFYATALKALKRDYGNPIIVSHLRVKSLFEFPPIKSNDRIALRNFHQKLKITITWLKSIGYEVPIKSNENLAKALLCLPYNMRNEFYKVTCNLDILDGDVDLIFLKKWLEKLFLIPLPISLPYKELRQIFNTKKRIKKTPDASKKTTKTLVCYLCFQYRRIMDCVKFKQKTAVERKNFVKEQKLCFNCLSKAHMLKECQSEFRCRVDGCRQKHHTLLHKEPLDNQNGNSDNRKQSPPQNNIPTDGNVNSFSKSNLCRPFLQVLRVYVTDINGKRLKFNALLDSGSDSTLISKTLADKLKLLGKQHRLNLCNVLNHKSTLIWKLVNFSICSDIHPEKVQIQNAWVVEHLNLPKHEINPDHLRNKFSHLKDVDFHLSDVDNVSILIGADIPELHICYDVRQGSKNQPIALLTLLGWVLMGGIDSKATQINSNQISVNNKNLENSIENFWKILLGHYRIC